jgi:hypothetical protein
MTYMGKEYYPKWLDNLADDVTLEAAAMDGAAHGAKDVGAILVVLFPPDAREVRRHPFGQALGRHTVRGATLLARVLSGRPKGRRQ